MKRSIGTCAPFFNTHRMVDEYTERLYLPPRGPLPAADRGWRHSRQRTWPSLARAGAVAWPEVRVVAVETPVDGVLKVGEPLQACARVDLGGLAPDDVAVEFALGRVEPGGALAEAAMTPMRHAGARDGVHEYVAETFRPTPAACTATACACLPRHPDLEQPFVPGLITWAS